MNTRTQRIIWFGMLMLMLSTLAFAVFIYSRIPRIAYIRSYDLINKYVGTTEARTKFEHKKSTIKANVDSLQLNFEQSRSAYMAESASLSVMQRQAKDRQFMEMQEQIYQYSTVVDEKIKEEDAEMMGAVLNQVNSYVEQYAKANGLDIVIGTTLSGNLLYGEDALDVTDDVLKGMNAQYSGEKK